LDQTNSILVPSSGCKFHKVEINHLRYSAYRLQAVKELDNSLFSLGFIEYKMSHGTTFQTSIASYQNIFKKR
jgi:hypothetical protein